LHCVRLGAALNHNITASQRIPSAVSLLACDTGALVRIERIPPELSCAQRLRELGIVEGAEILLLRRSDPLLVIAKESRIAIDLATAKLIEVSCG
ncbi:MAG: ferrous iron transport protein A, partial [bacterium]|nr:ferrous iron transport protein A [bacterium]